MFERSDGRQADELRPVTLERGFLDHPHGAVLACFGKTRVLCTATVDDRVPSFVTEGGWLTAEYAMLPGSTGGGRKSRKIGGREKEIQRLIGRCLRTAVDLNALGPRAITLDCDVLQADGGTRTAAITGAFVALTDCLDKLVALGELPADHQVIRNRVAAISVGIVSGVPLLDLCYVEDASAEVDLNVVMSHDGRFIEIQGTAEREPFSDDQLAALLTLARKGIGELALLQ